MNIKSILSSILTIERFKLIVLRICEYVEEKGKKKIGMDIIKKIITFTTFPIFNKKKILTIDLKAGITKDFMFMINNNFKSSYARIIKAMLKNDEIAIRDIEPLPNENAVILERGQILVRREFVQFNSHNHSIPLRRIRIHEFCEIVKKNKLQQLHSLRRDHTLLMISIYIIPIIKLKNSSNTSSRQCYEQLMTEKESILNTNVNSPIFQWTWKHVIEYFPSVEYTEYNSYIASLVFESNDNITTQVLDNQQGHDFSEYHNNIREQLTEIRRKGQELIEMYDMAPKIKILKITRNRLKTR